MTPASHGWPNVLIHGGYCSSLISHQDQPLCYVLQSVFLSGLCFPDSASPALSAGLSQGLVLDPSLKLVCGSFSRPTSLDSFTPQAGPSVLSPKKPIFLWSHSSPGWFCPTVHGLSVSLPPKHPHFALSQGFCAYCCLRWKNNRRTVPSSPSLACWFLCTLQCMARIFWEAVCTISVSGGSTLVHTIHLFTSLDCPLLDCAC